MTVSTDKSIQKPVFFDSNGTVHDFFALIVLLTLDKFRLTGISITNGNCYTDDAVDTTFQILNIFDKNEVEVAKSSAEAKNDFLETMKKKNHFATETEILCARKVHERSISDLESAEFTAQKLLREESKTTIVLIGPASNLVKTFKLFPETIYKVDKILWMGGALLADGNVNMPDHDGSAEWNMFWSPADATILLKLNVPIFLFPLDVCLQLPIDNYLMYYLEKSEDEVCRLGYQFLTVAGKELSAYLLKVVPVAYLQNPDLFDFESIALGVETRGTSMGNIYKTDVGNKIKVAKNVDDTEFYDFIIRQLYK